MVNAVVLAGGMGTRIQQPKPGVRLSDSQSSVAATGVKALMPIPSPPCRIERPFLDYVLSAVADAGFRRICLVVGPQNYEQLERYSDHLDRRVEVTLAIQQKPLGTANALASAADFAGDDPFLMINSDNCYPTSALRALHDLEQSGLIGFDRQVLATKGNIPADRISSFASIETDDQGFLVGITEKSPIRSDNDLISMNCWRFGPEIFTACRNIEPSQRGEYEIPDAVRYSIAHLGVRYQMIRSSEPVLDLSYQSDIGSVAEHLSKIEVRP